MEQPIFRDLETERILLGTIFADAKIVQEIVPLLGADDFQPGFHQALFSAIAERFVSGKPIEVHLLFEDLAVTNADNLDALKRFMAHLMECWTGNPQPYVEKIRDTTLKRNLSLSLAKVLDDARSGGASGLELLERAEAEVSRLNECRDNLGTVPMSKALQEYFDYYDRLERGEVEPGLPYGLLDLDRFTAGMRGGELIILGARPACGKSALALNIARHVALNKTPVLFCSLEMTRRECIERLLCLDGQINHDRIKRGRARPEELERMSESRERLDPASRELIHFDDSANQSIMRIVSNARRHKFKDEIGFIVIDYLQLVEEETSKKVRVFREKQRYEIVGQISRRLKQLAKELCVPILACAQVGRDADKRSDRTPRLSDLRESGNIEADADVVLLLHPHQKESGEINLVDLIIAKQRSGPCETITLAYRAKYIRYENHSPE